MIVDFCVVGGGIVGLATAMGILERRPGASIVLIEKEAEVGAHQTGHNSGVIHSGIYYAPDSLKARLCREGCDATKVFCAEHGIAFEECGKLIVATSGTELATMDALFERSRANNVAVTRLGAGELAEREPNIRGLGALLVPTTGIVDYRRICREMARKLKGQDVEIVLGEAVTAISEETDGVLVATPERSLRCRRLVVCAGLQSDRLARLAGIEPDVRIVPFKGEYFRLPAERNEIVRHLIYPVPDPALPFLGVHLTRMIDGSVTVGPNAVLAFSREGYSRFAFNLRDAASALAWPGLWRVVGRHFRTSMSEMKNSFYRRGYLDICRRYCPSLTLDDLLPHPPGIRAQAVQRDGTLVHDFLLRRTERMLHVLNAPSPAATAAIPIGRMIVSEMFDGA